MSGGSAGGGGRPLRGAALAALSTLLTAVGHLAGGGAAPDLTILVVLFPLLAGVFVSVAERSRGTVGMIATLGAGQLVLHELMVLLHPAQHALAEPAVDTDAGMLGMHAVVTLVTAAVLRYADSAAAGLLAALRRVVPRRLPPLPADRPLPTLAVPGPAVPARLARVLAAAHGRRGPPVGC